MLGQNVNDNGENSENMRDEKSILDDNTDEIVEHIDVGVPGLVMQAMRVLEEWTNDWMNEGFLESVSYSLSFMF